MSNWSLDDATDVAGMYLPIQHLSQVSKEDTNLLKVNNTEMPSKRKKDAKIGWIPSEKTWQLTSTCVILARPKSTMRIINIQVD